ncbi:hypothetical protein M404DRAFT_35447 [Pisolithus tinctorius Marx 270]|uniref:Uncharacterized protein n=1 Tax=Pisolithus tinctorius Marx 270 TaxID=870435 RepID=A0A0C3NE24_PISTI|nr:hypothetical protein M404DRAFT_35447 [Pisolithus tinctorius Marx 270]
MILNFWKMGDTMQVQVQKEEHSQPLTHPGDLQKGHGLSHMEVEDYCSGGRAPNHVADDASQNPKVGRFQFLERDLSQLEGPDASSHKFQPDFGRDPENRIGG